MRTSFDRDMIPTFGTQSNAYYQPVGTKRQAAPLRHTRPLDRGLDETEDEFTLDLPRSRPNWKDASPTESLWRPLSELNTFSLKITFEG